MRLALQWTVYAIYLLVGLVFLPPGIWFASAFLLTLLYLWRTEVDDRRLQAEFSDLVARYRGEDAPSGELDLKE